ncbi:MAG: prefoldin subunit alpha [Halococcoides sp.]
MSQGGRQQLEQIVEAIEEIEAEQDDIRSEIDAHNLEQDAIEDAIEAIESLETDETVQVPLGGGAHVRAQIADIEEIIVEIGNGYAAERDAEGAVETLELKLEAHDDRIDELNADIEALDEESDELEQRAQQLQQQLQQQQMQQQMQQQQAGESDE